MPASQPISDEHEQLTRLERQLALAQQITHVGSWEWDPVTGAVTWSDELYRIYGFEPRSRAITFEFFLSRLHPDEVTRVQREVGEALQRGGRFAYPERIVRPDGTVRELDTVGEALRGPDGRVAGLVGTCRDVTAERRRDETIRVYADIVHHMQIGLAVWEVGDAADIDSVRLLTYNPAAEPIARRPLDGCTGRPFREIFPFGAGSPVETLLLDVARTRDVREAVVERSQNPSHPTRAVSAKAFPLPGGRVGLAVEDVTEATRARRLKDAEHHVLERIASGAALNGILESLVLAIEDYSPPTLGSILLLDADGVHVRHGAAPHLPATYTQAIDGRAIGPRAGSCGTAAFERRPVYVEDIETDPLWADYRELARAHGLRACWSTPIFSNEGTVLGTFALYYREPRAPTAEDLALIDRATHLAGIAIEHLQLEDQLRALSAHVESVREDERTGIAREIHDVLGQALTALKMDLAWVARRAVGQEALLEKLSTMGQATDEIIQQVRRISTELRPGVLDDLGLLAAIEWQAQEFEERTGTLCSIESNLDDAPLPRDVCTALFRIFQEALTNVARHAGAEHVAVVLRVEGEELRLDVRDDGRGITHAQAGNPRSLGLLGIRERARRLGGAVSISGGAPGGTLVSVRVPRAGRGAS
ncbi:MAG TPA: GAF domain-containing protein [Polyangiaceae bacterium]|nr:GAF domain-containing protein [Polyangiaceae bacterium]